MEKHITYIVRWFDNGCSSYLCFHTKERAIAFFEKNKYKHTYMVVVERYEKIILPTGW